MPYTLKTQQISVKDPDSGEYIGVDVLAEQNKESLIAEIQSEGDLQVERVDQKSAEILAAGDTQVTRINQTGTNVQNLVDQEEARAQQIVTDAQTSLNTLETQKNTIAETVASMAELGTDTTLTTPGMAADAKAVGDVKGEVDNLGDFVYDQDSGLSTKAPAITDSASSGDIVTFESDVEGGLVSKLTGTIEPIQDLHGYDYPWPAGGGKNKLNSSSATDQTISDVSFKRNSDGTFTVNGTASATALYWFNITLPAGSYVFNGCPANGSWETYGAMLYAENVVNVSDYGNGVSFTLSETSIFTVRIRIASGTTANNLLFKLMIRLATETDATFAPYENICPITGYTEANVSSTGINVWDEEWEPGTLDASGEPLVSSVTMRCKNFIAAKAGLSYRVIGPYTVTTTNSILLKCYDINKDFVDGVTITAPGIFTVPNDSRIKYMRFAYRYYLNDSGGTYNNDVSINYPATDTAYHPYTGSTIPVSFPTEAGTVYSGTIDPISGKLVVTRGGIDLGMLTYTKSSTIQNGFVAISGMPSDFPVAPSSRAKPNWLSDRYKIYTNVGIEAAGVDGAIAWRVAGAAQGVIIRDSNYAEYYTNNNMAAFKTAMSGVQLVYELATHIEYQCAPAEVKTLLGTNNIWLDTGTITECVYPKDTKKYIDNKSAVKAPVIINNAEGDIASFTDGAEDMPVKSLVASIEPVQDLHGYDSPWPAGGGKNKFGCADGTYTNGTVRTITVVNGIWTYTVNMSATSKVFITPETITAMGIPTLSAGTYVFSLDSSAIPTAVTRQVLNLSDGQQVANGSSFTISSDTSIVSIASPDTETYNVGTYTCNIQIKSGSSATTWEPYANICPISGHTGLTVTRTGKNMMDLTKWEIDSALSNTIIIQNGIMTVSSYAYEERYNRFVIPKKDQYVFSLHVKTISINNDNASFYIYAWDENDTAVSRSRVGLVSVGYESDVLLTIPNTAKSIRFGEWGYSGQVELSSIQLELGSTASTYEPYTGTTIPITWETEAGTVYGGSIDVASGKMMVDSAFVSFDGSENWGLYTSVPNHFQVNEPNVLPNEQNTANSISNQYTSRVYINSTNRSQGIFSADGNHIRIKDDRFSTVADFKAFLAAQYNANTPVEVVYKLATPIEYQLTPTELTTLLGTNNIWTDAGSVSVDYSADTKLFIQNAIAEALSNSSNP